MMVGTRSTTSPISLFHQPQNPDPLHQPHLKRILGYWQLPIGYSGDFGAVALEILRDLSSLKRSNPTKTQKNHFADLCQTPAFVQLLPV
jgi:hypothetical protein